MNNLNFPEFLKNNILNPDKGIKKILLTLHPDPDLDSLCSNFAFKKAIENLSKIEAVLIGGDDYHEGYFPECCDFMTKEVIPKSYKQYTEEGGDFDIFFILDISRPQRISKDLSFEEFEKLRTVIIDHHSSNSFSESENCKIFLDSRASSTCELLVNLFDFRIKYAGISSQFNFNNEEKIALYLGIFSDTKGFTFATSSKTLRIAGSLKEGDDGFMDLIVSHAILRLWNTDDLDSLQSIVNNFSIFSINEKKIGICLYDCSIHIHKVQDLLSKKEGLDVLIVAKHMGDRYWIEILSWFPDEAEIAKKLALKFNGGGHANRAGGSASNLLGAGELKEEILEKLEEIL
ncbi:MAG: DHH family phosphoesterase [Candidatus Paceibacterota bacterium]